MELKNKFFVLSELQRLYVKQWTIEWNRMNDLGLSLTHGMLLEILASEGPQQPSQLAEALLITSGAITGISDKLVKEGLIQRIRNEDIDRRAIFLELTEAGKCMVEKLIERRTELEKQFFGQLSDDEVYDLIRIYDKLLGDIDIHKLDKRP